MTECEEWSEKREEAGDERGSGYSSSKKQRARNEEKRGGIGDVRKGSSFLESHPGAHCMPSWPFCPPGVSTGCACPCCCGETGVGEWIAGGGGGGGGVPPLASAAARRASRERRSCSLARSSWRRSAISRWERSSSSRRRSSAGNPQAQVSLDARAVHEDQGDTHPRDGSGPP